MIPAEAGNAIGAIGKAPLPALSSPCLQMLISAISEENGNAILLTSGCRTNAWRRRCLRNLRPPAAALRAELMVSAAQHSTPKGHIMANSTNAQKAEQNAQKYFGKARSQELPLKRS